MAVCAASADPAGVAGSIRLSLPRRQPGVRDQVLGLLGAVVAWADGQIDTVALMAAVWAAAQACFIRAGMSNEVAKSQEAR